MSDKNTKVKELCDKATIRLQSVLGRVPNPHEAINAATDVGLMMQVLMDEVADIKLRLDNAKL